MEVPVYLVLSKADLLLGFDEYFDNLSSDENDQVLGVSFRKDQDGTDLQVVRQQFQDLLQRLNSQVIMRLHQEREDRKSTRLNSSHVRISYAVFCLKKKKQQHHYL